MPKFKSTHSQHHHHQQHQRVHQEHQAVGLAPSPSNLQSLQTMMSTGIATSSSSPMSAPPRKVSFEDGHSDDSTSACSESSAEGGVVPLHHPQPQQQQQQHCGEETKEVRLCRSNSSHKPRLLARHSPSLSLVDLARTLAMEDDSMMESSSLSMRKRPHSAPVSPITGVVLDPSRCLIAPSCASLLPPGMESTVEPWGHFVDMALPEKKKLRSLPKTIPLSARASKSSKRHARRKLSNPYGEYPHHTKLCFQPNKSESSSAASFGLSLPSSEALFRLKSSFQNNNTNNNKEPTEQVAADLERLHFDRF